MLKKQKSLNETKKLLSQFNAFMNRISNVYSGLTNIDKYELFGEANVALIKALQDFNPARSISFKAYAKYIIADALNEYVRNNKIIVSIPRYIARANQIINRIKKLIEYDDDLFYYLYSENIVSDNEEVCNELKLLKNAAERAKITVNDLIARAEFLPLLLDECEITNSIFVESDEHKKLMAKLFVNQIRQKLTKEELTVADHLMEGMTVNEISISIGISYNKVAKIITAIRKKVLTLLE